MVYFHRQPVGGEAGCGVACPAAADRVDLCSNTHSIDTFDPMLTLWCYLLVRVLNGFTLGNQ